MSRWFVALYSCTFMHVLTCDVVVTSFVYRFDVNGFCMENLVNMVSPCQKLNRNQSFLSLF